MNWLDTTVKILALAVLAAFLGIIIWKVPEPDLVIVSLLAWGFAAYDNLFRNVIPRRSSR